MRGGHYTEKKANGRRKKGENNYASSSGRMQGRRTRSGNRPGHHQREEGKKVEGRLRALKEDEISTLGGNGVSLKEIHRSWEKGQGRGGKERWVEGVGHQGVIII